jgi:hypothetical protein
VTGASRFLIGLMTRFATDDGIPRGGRIKTEGEVIDRAIADKDRLGIEACLARFCVAFPQPLGRSFPQVLVALHDLGSAYACFGSEVGDAEDGVEAAAGGAW